MFQARRPTVVPRVDEVVVLCSIGGMSYWA